MDNGANDRPRRSGAAHWRNGGAALDGKLVINQAVVQAQGEGLTIETALLSQLLPKATRSAWL
jgi:hypothetical protein